MGYFHLNLSRINFGTGGQQDERKQKKEIVSARGMSVGLELWSWHNVCLDLKIFTAEIWLHLRWLLLSNKSFITP
jgi:hypothetical protein